MSNTHCFETDFNVDFDFENNIVLTSSGKLLTGNLPGTNGTVESKAVVASPEVADHLVIPPDRLQAVQSDFAGGKNGGFKIQSRETLPCHY